MADSRYTMAIDPGKNGGIAWYSPSFDEVFAEKMPETPKDLWIFLSKFGTSFDVWIEENRGYIPGNSGAAASKFAKHIGHIEMALIGNRIPYNTTTPTKWMKKFLEGSIPSDKKERKNRIKTKVQGLYPHIKVTLALADALGLLHTKIGE